VEHVAVPATTFPKPTPVPVAIAAACGALIFAAALGPSLIDPENIDWLMRGDFALHFLGWHLYRTSPWEWPPGSTPNLIWPVGSSVGLTDSIPIASFFFKLLDPLLPPTFQFIGLWLVLCFALQGAFGVLLMRLATPNAVLQVLGALVFVLSPPLAYRFGHAALTAHWVLLAAFWLGLRDANVPSRGGAVLWALLVGVTAAIQPYLLLMVALLMLGTYARYLVVASQRAATIAAHAAGGVAAAVVGLWLSGSLMVPTDAGLIARGFGAYSANLLTFVMPTELNAFFALAPARYSNPLQYEGYAYLGGGVIALGAVVLVGGLGPRERAHWRSALTRHLPAIVVLLFLAAMALGPVITAGSRTLFTYDDTVWKPLAAFRTHGRMIWPLYYGIVTAILFGAVRFRTRVAMAMLSASLLMQAVDMAPMVPWIRDVGQHGFRNPLQSPFWSIASRHYKRIIMIPSNLCDRDGALDVRPFALLAGETGRALNGGATARYNVQRASEYCEELQNEIQNGLGVEGSLYVIRRDLFPTSLPAAPGRVCSEIDGIGICVSASSYERWRQEFDLSPRR
jgi:hypothetical protein